MAEGVERCPRRSDLLNQWLQNPAAQVVGVDRPAGLVDEDQSSGVLLLGTKLLAQPPGEPRRERDVATPVLGLRRPDPTFDQRPANADLRRRLVDQDVGGAANRLPH